jgi:hypothetical protein
VIQEIHRTVHPANLIKAKNTNNSIALPVRSSQALYARFKHVRGYPNQQGFSLNKLRTLNLMIEILGKESLDSSIKESLKDSSRITNEETLKSLAEQIYQKGQSGGYANPGNLEGALINLIA